jgi:hypothetical protein
MIAKMIIGEDLAPGTDLKVDLESGKLIVTK